MFTFLNIILKPDNKYTNILKKEIKNNGPDFSGPYLISIFL